MLRIPGQAGKDFCDKGLRPTRRDLLRVGGASMLGLSLGSMFELQAMANSILHFACPLELPLHLEQAHSVPK